VFSQTKLLSTTSIFALMVGANSIALGTGVDHVAQTDPSVLSSTTNWSPVGPVENGDSLTFNSRRAAEIDLPNIYITTIKGTAQLRRLDVKAPGLLLGVVSTLYSTSWGVLNIYDGYDITLVGGNNTSRTQSGGYNLEKVDFKALGSVINVNTSAIVDHPVDGLSSGPGNQVKIGGTVTNPANGTLNVITNFQIGHPDWATIATINIGTADAAAMVFFDSRIYPTVTLSGDFNFLHADSNLYIDFAQEVNITEALCGDTDLTGKLLFRTRGTGGATLKDVGGSIGVSNTHRLKSIRMWGDSSFIINVPVYVETFDMNTETFTATYDIACNAVVDCGINSLISFYRNNQSFHFNDDVSVTTIDFNGTTKSTVYFGDGKNATANIVGNASNASTVAGVLYLNGTNFVGTISNVSSVYAGSAGATAIIGAGDHKITQLQILDTTGAVEFADGANLRITNAGSGGAINSTGGAAGTISFSGSSTIEGTIGANVAPIAIVANGDANSIVTFNDAIKATTLTIGAGTVELSKGFTGNIEAADADTGILSLTGAGQTIIGTIGATSALGAIDLQKNATFNDAVTVSEVFLNGGIPTFNSTFTGSLVATEATGTLAMGNINANLVVNGGDITVTDSSANVTINGGVLTVDNIFGDLSVNGGDLTLNGSVGGGLAVGGDAVFNTVANIAGDVTVNSTNINASTVGDVAGDVTVTAGVFAMNDATGASSTVTLNGGSLTINNITHDLVINGGDLTLNGSVGGGLTIGGNAVFNTVANIAGDVTINSTNANASTVGDVAGDVIVTTGALAMNDATGASSTVTLNGGSLTINNIIHDLVINGGDLTLNGSVGGSLQVTGSAFFAGDADNTDVAGIVTINTDNINANIIHDAADDITVTSGTLIMNDATNAASTISIAIGTANIHAIAGNLSFTDDGSANISGNIDGTVDATSAGNGTLSFTGNSTIIGTIGASAAIGTINAGAANSTVTFSSAASADTLNIDAGIVEFVAGFAGDIEAKNDGAGTLSFIGDGAVTGAIGAINKPAVVNLQADNIFSSSITATDLSLDGGSATFNASVTGDITSTVNGGNLTVTTITGNLDFTNGGTLVSATSVSGNLTVGSDGSITTIETIGGDAALSGAATAVATGAVGGSLQVAGSAFFAGDADNTDVAGIVTINTDNVNANIIHDAEDDVTVTAGTLIMNDAIGPAARVTLNGGSLTINNITHDLVINSGDLILNGIVAGAFTIGGNAVFNSSANIVGAVIVKSSNANASTLGDVAGVVTLKAGSFIMKDAGSNVNASGGTGVFNSVSGILTLTNAADVSVANDIGGAINTGADSTLTLINAGTVAGEVAALGTLTIQADRTFAKNVSAANLVIEGDNTKLILTGGDLGASNISSSRTDGRHQIVVSADQNITGNVGSKDNPIGALVLDADITANINSPNFYSISITTNTDSEGSISFGADVAGVSSLGTADKKLKSVSFNADTVINGDVYSSSINIADGQTAYFGKSVITSNFSLDGATSKAIFDEGAIIDFSVASNGGGIAEFSGNTSINADLGDQINSLSGVTFRNNDESIVKLSADIFADEFIFTKGALRLERAATITGNSAINSATLNLTDKALAVEGDLTLNGDNIVKIKIADSKDGTKLLGGSIMVNGDLIFANGTKLIIEPNDLRSSKDVKSARSFSLFSVTGNTTGIGSNISVTPSSAWTVNATSKGITLNEIVNVFPEPTSSKSSFILSDTTIKRLQQITKNAPAEKNVVTLVQNKQIAQLFTNLLDSNEAKITETIERVTQHSVLSASTATNSIGAMVSNVGNAISNRVVDISATTTNVAPSVVNTAPATTNTAPSAVNAAPTTTNTAPSAIKTNLPAESKDNYISGVSSGDEDKKLGAWINPFYSLTNQGHTKISVGYTNESYGASFGFDTKLNNDAIIGIAFTSANANIKHKASKSGDRTRINSKLFSIYNLQHINDQWFALGTATVALNEIQNHAKRVVSESSYEIANSKYNSKSFSLKEIFGYSYVTKGFAVITPMFGLKFNNINGTSYKEFGTSFQNLSISTKSSRYLEAVAGVKINSAAYYPMPGMIISPEFHGFVNYNLSNQGQTPTVVLNGSELQSASSKSVRTNYNLGTGLTISYGSMEYSANYDVSLAHKLVGHQGSVKVRVSF
jgi:hypothetical protein